MTPPASTPSAEPPEEAAAPPRARRRTLEVAATIKDWIIARGLEPGDRLPQERQLIEELGVAKGTVREALRVLEAEGLIRTRTGPGGGAFITKVGRDRAQALLANHFLFEEMSIASIYELRIALEPQLVADLAPKITEAEIAALRAKMSAYSAPPASVEEEKAQRAAELEFHEALAELAENPLLGFVCGFLIRMLKDLTVCKRIYERPNPELRERGVYYQEQLIEALRAHAPEDARAVMEAHMREAQRIMLEQEAEVTRGFL